MIAKNRIKAVRQAAVNFTDREIIGSNDDKPKCSLLIELLGCSIKDFSKNYGLFLKQLVIQIEKSWSTRRMIHLQAGHLHCFVPLPSKCRRLKSKGKRMKFK